LRLSFVSARAQRLLGARCLERATPPPRVAAVAPRRHLASPSSSSAMASPTVHPPGRTRALYPEVEPYATRRLAVGGPLAGAGGATHELHVEEVGNPAGKPVVVLHGGPGGGCNAAMRRYFDPSVYRVVLFDQRGAGRSTPFACLEANTTWDLVADIEAVRVAVGVDAWQVWGGSWGSTLALAYAQAHPARVTELVLRGIFTLRRSELEAFYQDAGGPGAQQYPAEWRAYVDAIPEGERADLMAAYHARITGAHGEPEMRRACKAWSLWEGQTSKLLPDAAFTAHYGEDDFSLAFARIESHYFHHGGWLAKDQLLEGVDKIRHIPATIVQGRYDIVCPATTAFELAARWPQAHFVIVPDAGHSATEPGTTAALLDATDKYRPSPAA